MSTATTVLVTGVNGYVGACTTLELLRKGYRVKGTVRSQDKADAFLKQHPSVAPDIEWVITQDIMLPEAFDSAVEGVDYIIHIASPFAYSVTDNERDLLLPAREGTLSIMRAAAKQPRVKQVVVTSSFAAVIDYKKGSNVGYTYTVDDWNPATWEEASKSDDVAFVYCASKALAERAAWDFIEKEHPHFSLTTFCPPLIIGPSYQPYESMDMLNASVGLMWKLISGKEKKVPVTGSPVYIDVRDLASLQVASLSNPKARNQRYFTAAGHFSNDQAAHIVASSFPAQAHRIPPSDNSAPTAHYGTDSSKAERDFEFTWTPFEKTIVDMARDLYAKEKQISERS